MIQIAIFASGGGSNAKAILQYFQGHSTIAIQSILSNRKEAGVFDHAKSFCINSIHWSKSNFDSQEFTLQKLQGIDVIVLAGFLLKVPEYLTKAFEGRIINIHPALLPKYGGKGMYGMNVHRAVFEAQEKETGITIHLVDEEFDHGEHLFQKKINIESASSAEEISEKVLKLEHKHFAPTIERFIENHF